MTDLLARAGLRRMRPRDPREPHRAASTLELFFDLTFVVGVSAAAGALLHGEESGLRSLLPFLVAFFSVWWPWVNFTWFASAFDTDDWLYRLLTILQMAGVLVVAAGIPRFVATGDLLVPVAGYVLMRLALVAQWLRAAQAPEFRTTALRYAGGVALVQLLWVLLLLAPAPAAAAAGVVVLVAAELAVPVWAERTRVTPFHRHHIAERYGLFTLIVLGEGLLSVTTALSDAQRSIRGGELVLLGATALVLIAGMWWAYFSRPSSVLGVGMRGTFVFGYLHYVVFGAAAALASGVELGIEQLLPGAEEHPLPVVAVQAAATVPLALFLLATWYVVLRHALGRVAAVAVPALAVLCGLTALLPAALQVAAALVVVLVVVLEADGRRAVLAS